MGKLHNTGEEYIMDLIKGSVTAVDVDVGLYNSSDSLSESDNISDISTEPDDADQYSRQTVTKSNLTVDLSGSDAQVDLPKLTFQTDDNTQDVDKAFVVVNFQSYNAGDSSPSDNLFFTFDLSQSRDLSQIEELNVTDAGGEIT